MRPYLALVLILGFGNGYAFKPPQYDRSFPRADDTRIVGIECNRNSNTLEVGYFTAYNLPTKTMDLWNTFDLKKNAPDGCVESVYEVKRRCNLGKDRYLIIVRAVPGNWNLNGQCGGATYGGTKIFRNRVLLFDGDFEECSLDGEIVTKVLVRPGMKPLVSKVSRKEFF
ncbi:MAG: hypothetical protein LBE81_03285 [Azonexus sp.]|nr:hypothetical protein [Azonexus sp.]